MTQGSPVQIGQLLAGKYRVDRILGQGGMGVVVAATHEQLDQKVAVKFLLPEAASHSQATARFLREARAAVRIQSEFVARVIDVGTLEETGTPYMVMEYLDGQDLEQLVESQGPLPIEEAVEYVMQACAALAEAHAHGIIHRDLKPANLFRTVRSDGTAVVKVLDFGISKMTLGTDGIDSANLTGTAAVLGTPMYMSPEQIRSSRDVDNRTDIWSLGSILQELLTGAQPFPADTMPQLFAAILEAHPTPLSSVRPEVPQGLQDVVHRCLSKSPDGRYPNVAALAADLAAYAPAHAVQLSERTSRVLGVAASAPGSASTPGLTGTHGSAAATIGRTLPAQTGTAWGTTQNDPGHRKLVLGASIAAALFGASVIAGLFFLRSRGETEASAEPAAANALAAPSSEASSFPAAPTPATETPTPSVEPIVTPSADPEPPPAAAAPVPAPPAPAQAPKPAIKRAPSPAADPPVTVAPSPRPAPRPARPPSPPPRVTNRNPLDIQLK